MGNVTQELAILGDGPDILDEDDHTLLYADRESGCFT